mmetsp:Transcript_5107/g.7058  ORF Transcript_5107/g.7058 Transcript_5107/m.7058 type:complete len:468 (+) Transcript_5107:136-1539(+)
MNLHECCKRGDLPTVRFLLEEKGLDINAVDLWNSTPLYYASLCGHENLMKYLLEMGARCEEDTYQGERCFYAALNDDLRRLLRNHRVTAAYRHPFIEFLRNSHNNMRWADVVFNIRGDCISAHRVILAARNQYFYDMFHGKWKGKSEIYISNEKVDFQAFRALIMYLYAGRLEVAPDYLPASIRLFKQCGIKDIEMKLSMVFESGQPKTVVVQQPLEEILDCFKRFSLEIRKGIPPFADVCFHTTGRTFAAHKIFTCGRSTYLEALCEGGFKEAVEAGNMEDSDNCLPMISVNRITPEAFSVLLSYLYSGAVGECNPSLLFEVLPLADELLLPGLKTIASSALVPYIDPSNVYDILEMATLFNLARLESCCMEVFAINLEEVQHHEEFKQLIHQSAMSLKVREAFDSIPFLDEIRFHITNVFSGTDEEGTPADEDEPLFQQIHHRNKRFQILDNLISELGLSVIKLH